MYQKLNLDQLRTQPLESINKYVASAKERKAELEALKAKGGAAWTKQMQDELNDIAVFLVDVEEIVEQASVATAVKDAAQYKVAPGTEKMVHLAIVRGRRFNPNTGKEESKTYNQMFTFGEWQLFKANHKNLGYAIMKVLHDPYGEASKFVINA